MAINTGIIAVSLSLATIANAQFGANTAWTNPNGSLGDFQQTYAANSNTDISWKPLNTSTSDLWITAWNQGTDAYMQQIIQNVDISVAGNYSWGFNVGLSQLSANALFVFHFVPAGTVVKIPYFGAAVSSPGFLVLAASNSTLTTTTPTSSGVPTSSTRTTSTKSSSTTSSTSTAVAAPSTTSSGLSTGAKAGIGAGVGLGAMIVLISAYFVVRQYRRRQSPPPYMDNTPVTTSHVAVGKEAKTQWNRHPPEVGELHANSHVPEMDAKSRPPVEAP